MKKMISAAAMLLAASLIFAQNNTLQIRATGTGRTNGHIADLNIYNPGAVPRTFTLSPCLIPSLNGKQPYIVPKGNTITVPAGSAANVPVNGYCADVTKPPVPSGAAMPSFSDWTTADPTLPAASVFNSAVPGWEPYAGIPGITVPGTNTAWPYTMDFSQNPAAAATVLLDAIQRISTTYDEMQNNGAITTPFSGNPEKERESVIQQTFWIYAAELTGKAYKKEDFRTNTVRQFETSAGINFNKADNDTRAGINAGVEQFWNTFEAVGTGAKVFKNPADGPGETIPIGNENCSTCLDDGKCECGDISFDLSVTHYSLKVQNDGNKNKREYTQKQPVKTAVKEDSQSGVGKDKAQPAAEVKPAIPGLKAGDEVSISLSNVKIDCPCTNGTSCEAYKPEFPSGKEGQEAAAKVKKAIDADAALGKANEDVAKIEEDLANAKTDLAKKNAENKLKKAKAKVEKLETELADANKDLEANGLTSPIIKVNGKDASGSWDTTTGAFTFSKDGDFGLKVGKVPFTFEFEVSFRCQSFKCDGVRCTRKFKVTL